MPGPATARRTLDWSGLLTYTGLALLAVTGTALGARALGPANPGAAALAGVAMLTPALAALVVRWGRREGFADAGFRLGPLKWYAIAWGLPVGMVVMDIGFASILGGLRFDPSPERLAALNPFASSASYDQALPGLTGTQTIIFMAFAALTIANAPMLIVGLGEEIGWRGYLLPRVLPLGPWPAFVLVGLVWWAWHLPLSLASPVTPDVSQVVLVPAGILAAILFGAVLGWLRFVSGSIFPVALAHIVSNNAAGASVMLFDLDTTSLLVSRVMTLVIVCAVLARADAWKVVR